MKKYKYIGPSECIYLEKKDHILNSIANGVELKVLAKEINLSPSTLRKKLDRDNIVTNSISKNLREQGLKRCSRCDNIKSISEFHKHKSRDLYASCKECDRNRQIEDYWKAKEDPIRVNRYEQWRKNYKEKNKEIIIFRRAKQRAERLDLDFDLELSDIVIPKYCPILGVEIGSTNRHYASIDRIDNSKGYIKGNIQIISYKANTMKNDATKEELLSFSKYFIEKYGEKDN